VKHTTWSTALSFSADGTGVVAHAGNVATRLLADQVGLTGALSAAMHGAGSPRPTTEDESWSTSRS